MQIAIDHFVDDQSSSDSPVGSSRGMSSSLQLIEKESRIASFSPGNGTGVYVYEDPSFPGGEDVAILENADVSGYVFIRQPKLRPGTPPAPGSGSGGMLPRRSANRSDASLHAGRTGNFPELKNYLLETSQYLSTNIMNELHPEIMELREAALEEESLGQTPLSNDSRRGLARFLNKLVDMGIYLIPGLDLTYEGNIRAEWELSLDETLILEFVDFFRLKFIFFYSDSSSGGTFRTSGSGSVSEFLDDYPRAMKFLRSLRD